MTMTEADELQTALRVVRDAGYDVLMPGRYSVLCAWINAGNKGWPPKGWVPETMQMHSNTRCGSVKIQQLRGHSICCRRPDHDGLHYDETNGQRWQ